MAFEMKRLADIGTLSASAASIFANPADKTSLVKAITLFNSHSSAVTVKLYRVPDSGGSLGTAAAGNQFFERELAVNETFLYEAAGQGMVLEDTNDSIQGEAGTASVVTVSIDGAQE